MRPVQVTAVAILLTTIGGCGPKYAPDDEATWPTRSVRFVTPLAAGGGPDLVVRVLAESLSKRWQQPVVVDNRPGADGVLAARAAIDASDDHTLLFAPNSIVTANFVDRVVSYALEDFTPIASVVDVPIAVVIGTAIEATGVGQLLESAKARPGRVTYTTVFGAPQIVWTRLLADRGIDMPLVGYRNPNIAIPDLIEGRVHVALLPLGTTLGAVRSGRLRILAVLGERRSGVVPDVPTIAEAGIPEASAEGALGLFAPRGIATARREWIAAEIAASLREPDIRQQLLTAGFEILSMGPADYAASLARQRARLQSAAAPQQREGK